MRFCTSCLKSCPTRLLSTGAVLSDQPRGQVALGPFMRLPPAVKQKMNRFLSFVMLDGLVMVLKSVDGSFT